MKINRDTWHYWLYKVWVNGRTSPTTNLCAYFWMVVFGAIEVALVSVLALAAVGGLGAFLYILGWHIYLSFRHHPIPSSLVALGVVSFVGVAYWWSLVRRPSDEPREPSLVWAYIEAKKSKVCPVVEFVDRG